MSIFSSGQEAMLGALGINPFLPCPPLPNFIAEWAAILPLVCHLADQQDDYITTGDVALRGRLSVGLLPRLGTLGGLARLLRRGTTYLDYASVKGGSSRKVWDVKWGSVFPCANGAAIDAISKSLRSQHRIPLQRMPETQSFPLQWKNNEKSPTWDRSVTQPTDLSSRDKQSQIGSKNKSDEDEPNRRYQILHVYQLYRKQPQGSLRQRLGRLLQSTSAQVMRFVFLIGFAVFLFLFGSYGTAVIIVCSSVSELMAHSVLIRRPAGYLKNNENHDACMLVASHENATEWHLYIGDRAIADTLLNKPMFIVPEGRSAVLVADWFWFADLLQLTAMTFVAAQKGWDGVCLMVVLALHSAISFFMSTQTSANNWLEREGVEAKVQSFEFGGRTAMMGAIQVFSESPNTSWMDTILVPHPRREAWLKRLGGDEGGDRLGAHDAAWLEFACEASFASAEVLERVFGVSNMLEI
ncbi:hypothetical protein V8C35DRAFT_305336 [Trichoderma chlorosporum]